MIIVLSNSHVVKSRLVCIEMKIDVKLKLTLSGLALRRSAKKPTQDFLALIPIGVSAPGH